MGKGFRQKLAERQKKIGSLVCVGLDPLSDKIPECVLPGKPEVGRILVQMCEIIDATAEYTCMYKPQRAHFEAIPNGSEILQAIIEKVHREYPRIPVFLDCKRGDIARTQERYRVAHFEIDGADGMNFSPYMGKDCMEQLVDKDHPGRAIVGLCYTSNLSARPVQDKEMADGRPYWEFIAEATLRWAEELDIVEDAGLVMAAAYEWPKDSGDIFSNHLTRCREIVGDKLWFLIPGIGTQGGFIAETVRAAYRGLGTIAIGSSSAITFASMDSNYAEAAGEKARELRDQIKEALVSTEQ